MRSDTARFREFIIIENWTDEFRQASLIRRV